MLLYRTITDFKLLAIFIVYAETIGKISYTEPAIKFVVITSIIFYEIRYTEL